MSFVKFSSARRAAAKTKPNDEPKGSAATGQSSAQNNNTPTKVAPVTKSQQAE